MVQYLLAAHTGQLCVMRDSSLVWAASLPHPPADITVAHFQCVMPHCAIGSSVIDL